MKFHRLYGSFALAAAFALALLASAPTAPLAAQEIEIRSQHVLGLVNGEELPASFRIERDGREVRLNITDGRLEVRDGMYRLELRIIQQVEGRDRTEHRFMQQGGWECVGEEIGCPEGEFVGIILSPARTVLDPDPLEIAPLLFPGEMMIPTPLLMPDDREFPSERLFSGERIDQALRVSPASEGWDLLIDELLFAHPSG